MPSISKLWPCSVDAERSTRTEEQTWWVGRKGWLVIPGNVVNQEGLFLQPHGFSFEAAFCRLRLYSTWTGGQTDRQMPSWQHTLAFSATPAPGPSSPLLSSHLSLAYPHALIPSTQLIACTNMALLIGDPMGVTSELFFFPFSLGGGDTKGDWIKEDWVNDGDDTWGWLNGSIWGVESLFRAGGGWPLEVTTSGPLLVWDSFLYRQS